ncbi:hypothetical protein [Saccharibacillus deserti]|uniref:hypothetical protein n=1 Tax=Saccharibacillus deserti TaxID=1634444 RepID=UPI001551C5D8|nr:hypothetical protein [Saccharibacillus deserti]
MAEKIKPELFLLSNGLSILSSCKKETEDIWQAHFGAAAIGSYFFVKNNRLDPDVRQRVLVQAQEMAYSVSKKDRGFGLDPDVPILNPLEAESILLTALERTIDGLHWVGHNVIYSAASLSAIRELDGWGSREQIAGIADLVDSFEKTIPGRSWIGCTASEVKRLTIDPQDHFPIIRTPEDLSGFVLEELAAFPVIYRAEAHHDLIGHLLTFSHALNILYDLGHPEFFYRGTVPLFKLAKALRASRCMSSMDTIKLVSPVDRLPLEQAKRSERLPIDSEFWNKDYRASGWDFGHVFKFSYSFYDHLARVETEKSSYTEAFRSILVQ